MEAERLEFEVWGLYHVVTATTVLRLGYDGGPVNVPLMTGQYVDIIGKPDLFGLSSMSLDVRIDSVGEGFITVTDRALYESVELGPKPYDPWKVIRTPQTVEEDNRLPR